MPGSVKLPVQYSGGDFPKFKFAVENVIVDRDEILSLAVPSQNQLSLKFNWTRSPSHRVTGLGLARALPAGPGI